MKPITISARLATMYGHAARNDLGSAVAKKGPSAERVQIVGDGRIRVIPAGDGEVARGLAKQQAEALDIARRLIAKASTLRGLDRRLQCGPPRPALRDERVEAHGWR
jgi:hypothetical protein